jgi:hypothetical protein
MPEKIRAAQNGERHREAGEGRAADRAAGSEADKILLKHEKRLTPAQKEYFGPQLVGELKAGTKAGETKVEKVIESIPENKALGRKSAADGGKDAPTDRDARIQLRANELLEERSRSQAQAEKDEFGAYAALSGSPLRDPARREQVITSRLSLNRETNNASFWTQISSLPEHLPRGAAITRGRVVMRGADANTAIPATANAVSLGIAEDHQQNVGRPFRVADRPGELTWGEAGAAFALDALLASDANGRLVTATTTQNVAAIARQAALLSAISSNVEIAPADTRLRNALNHSLNQR